MLHVIDILNAFKRLLEWAISRRRKNPQIVIQSEAPAYAISSQQRASSDIIIMSSQEPPNGAPASSKPADASASESAPLLAETHDGDAEMDMTPDEPVVETWEDIPDDVRNSAVDEISTRTRLIDNDIRVSVWSSSHRQELCADAGYSTYFDQVMRSEMQRLTHEQAAMQEKIRDNGEKIKQNKVLPYLVGNVVEVRALVVASQSLAMLILI